MQVIYRQKMAHGDAGVYEATDGERSAEFYVDYIDGSVTLNTSLSDMDSWLVKAQTAKEEAL